MTTIKEHLDKAVETVLDEHASLLERIDILQRQRDYAKNELAETRSQVEALKSELASERKKCLAHAINIAEIHDALDSACVGRPSHPAVERVDMLRKQRDDALNELRDTRKSNADMYAELEKAGKEAAAANTELDKMGVARCDGDLPRRIRTMFGLLQLTQQQRDGAVQELERVRSSGETDRLLDAHRALNDAKAPMWPNLSVPERIRALGKERDDAVAAERATATQRDMARNSLDDYKEAVKNAMAFLEEVNEGH